MAPRNETPDAERPVLLIVDDAPDNLTLLIGLFEEHYTVRVASGGSRALELAHRVPHPALILLDICMPGMDGYSVLSALKVDPVTTHIPVIFVTALSETVDVEKGLRLGAADYITKPINPDLLLSRVNTQLELSRYRHNPVTFDLNAAGGKRVYSVLIVDDTPEQVQHLMALLEGEYHIVLATSGEEALEVLEHEPLPDLVLLDVMMPGMDGYAVCQQIKHSPRSDRIPVIFVTVSDETQAKLRGFELGASDYITKPFDPDEVRARVRTHLEFSRLQRYLETLVAQRTAMLEVSEEKYRALVHRDPLTGLPNRVLLTELLTHGIAQSAARDDSLGLMVVDLYGFTGVNESFGYAVGDRILVESASRLRQLLPEVDTIARSGGDSFELFIDSGQHDSGLDLMAQRVMDALSQPMLVDGLEICITANVGVALYPDDGLNAEALLSRADAALQQAKRKGPGELCFFSPDMSSRARERLTIEADLRRALKQDELLLYYQPLVDLTNGQVVSMEALLRWQHPTRGLVLPMAFINIAEESGLIDQIGEWVIRKACAQIRQWLDRGRRPVRIAVNVSAIQINHGQLSAIVREALCDSGIEPALLELEITESALMSSPAQARVSLSELAALGVRLALDDFGTGYSSLSSLQRLGVHKLKIDMSFVRDLTQNQSNAAIVKSIVALGHSLDLKVVAEGVEEVSQAHYLRTLQCDQIQGYLVSRPMPADDTSAFLSAFALSWKTLNPQSGATVLLVDDEPSVLSSLKRLLRQENYRILTANSGVEALEILAANDVSVILSDQRMPGMTGTELLARARTMHPNTIRMVLSGHTGLDSLTEAINKGEIYKFLFKPWDDEEIRTNLREACRLHENLVREQRD